MAGIVCAMTGAEIAAGECYATVVSLPTSELAICRERCAYGKDLAASVRRGRVLPQGKTLKPAMVSKPMPSPVSGPRPLHEQRSAHKPIFTPPPARKPKPKRSSAEHLPKPEPAAPPKPKTRPRPDFGTVEYVLDEILARSMVAAFDDAPGPWVSVRFLGEIFGPEAYERARRKYTLLMFHVLLERREIKKWEHQVYQGSKTTVIPVEEAERFVTEVLGEHAWKLKEEVA